VCDVRQGLKQEQTKECVRESVRKRERESFLPRQPFLLLRAPPLVFLESSRLPPDGPASTADAGGTIGSLTTENLEDLFRVYTWSI